MHRRTFLTASLGLPISWAAERRNHRLPESDVHYRRVRGYVEDVPVPQYQWAPDSAYEAFRDIKYGVRIHWGLYSIWAQPGESWPFLTMPNPKKQAYQQLYHTWNPQGFDANSWMDLFAACGMKMFAFTSKHHDGFSLFDTKARVVRRVNYTAPGGPRIETCDLSYSIMETPFRRDVVRELCQAARKRGIKIDLYFSHPDWYDADFRPYNNDPLQTPSSPELEATRKRLGSLMIMTPEPTPAEVAHMMARHRQQLEELLTNYGPIDMLGLDQWLGSAVWPQLRETILRLRAIQPNVMLRARGIGNYGDYYTPEGFVPSDKANTDTPWFVIRGLGASFSYDPNPANYKGAGWIIQNLLDAVSKGGNFMVGVGPDGNGKFHPTAIAQLREAGEWLRVNSEAIFATRARDGELWREGDHIRFTRTKDRRTVYALLLSWPGSEVRLATVRPLPESPIRMLGYPTPLPWTLDPAQGLLIRIPPELQNEERRPCRFAWTLRLNASA